MLKTIIIRPLYTPRPPGMVGRRITFNWHDRKRGSNYVHIMYIQSRRHHKPNRTFYNNHDTTFSPDSRACIMSIIAMEVCSNIFFF